MANVIKPRIVTLCGSTRFKDAFEKAQFEETLAGRIVLTVGFAHHSNPEWVGNLSGPEWEDAKEKLDWLHMRKIDLSDEILVLNVGGYVGESTSREIAYAYYLGRTIRWLESDKSDDPSAHQYWLRWKTDPFFLRITWLQQTVPGAVA